MPYFTPAWLRFTHVLAKTRCFLVGVWCFEGDFVSRGFRMKNVKMFTLAAMFLAVVGFSLNAAADSKSIKEVMKGGNFKKCCEAASKKDASDADKKAFAELCESLAANKCPKGDEESWKAKTSALVAASKALVAGDKDAGKKVGAAANCKACHDVHKGK
jgi:hypothetical protein